MLTSQMIREMKDELSCIQVAPTTPCEISSYKDLAWDIAQVSCRVSCAIANRDEKGITQIKWRMHQRELKRALKEQRELIPAIFQNESS